MKVFIIMKKWKNIAPTFHDILIEKSNSETFLLQCNGYECDGLDFRRIKDKSDYSEGFELIDLENCKDGDYF